MEAYYYSFESPIGKMKITFTEKGILRLYLPNEKNEDIQLFLNKYSLKKIKVDKSQFSYHDEIISYLEGNLKQFNLPLDLRGTSFQKKVWTELRAISYGQLKSYKDISISIGRNKAFRAVGSACNKNPIPIIIPCHRVVSSGGKLTGYRGGIKLKERLISLEKLNI